MNKKLLVSLSVIVGLLFVVLAAIYFIEPAKSLPSFVPGFDPSLAQRHYKHAIGSLFLGLGLFAFAWFQSGKKSSSK